MLKFIKNSIKYIYKQSIISFFKKIYPYPLYLKKNKNDDAVEKFKIKLGKNNYTLFRLYKGRVFTNTNDTTAYISKNNNLCEGSMQYYKFDGINSYNGELLKNATLKTGTPKFKKKIKGNILSLLSGGASRDNFTHWFTDVLPRVMIYEKKFNLKNINKFYVPSVKYHFQKETLKILGINDKKIISSEKVKHLSGDNIYATTHPCFHLPAEVKKWSLEYLNKKFKSPSNTKHIQKIFIDRDQLKLIDKRHVKKFKNFRVLLNEIEIKEFLKSKNFKIIKPENFSFKEQLKIFSSAKYIVGLYGAALMMLAFCKKKTNILEIKPTMAGNEFKNISKLRGLNHVQINIDPIYKSTTPQNGLIYCPIDIIDKKIKSFN